MLPLEPHTSGDSKGENIELIECDSAVKEDKDSEQHPMDTSLTGQLECLRIYIHTMSCMHVSYSPVSEYVKPIPVSEFSIHVEKLHADRDKLFEMEYTVN